MNGRERGGRTRSRLPSLAVAAGSVGYALCIRFELGRGSVRALSFDTGIVGCVPRHAHLLLVVRQQTSDCYRLATHNDARSFPHSLLFAIHFILHKDRKKSEVS